MTNYQSVLILNYLCPKKVKIKSNQDIMAKIILARKNCPFQLPIYGPQSLGRYFQFPLEHPKTFERKTHNDLHACFLGPDKVFGWKKQVLYKRLDSELVQ